jgi:aspartyl-tRNA(Asn)/glutamyl-tRNA(Gln) amidotransferase subunit B
MPRTGRQSDQAAKLQSHPKVFGWFVGQVMKATRGQANPQLVKEVLKEEAWGLNLLVP